MAASTSPNDIARRTLRLLATRRIAPTPERYREIYAEVAGVAAQEPAPAAEMALRRLVTELPSGTPELAQLASQVSTAADARDWDTVCATLVGFARRQQSPAYSSASWRIVLRELLRVTCEGRQLPACADRLGAIDKALAAGGDIEALYLRLRSLSRSWAPPSAPDAAANAEDRDGPGSMEAELRETLAETLELGVAARLFGEPELAAEATGLARRLRGPASTAPTSALRAQLRALWLRIEQRGRARDELQDKLHGLLRLLVDNVGELVVDDQWLRGQMTVVQQALARPLNREAMEEAERHLQNAIFKQSLLKQSLNEAKTMLKQMVASFIDQLGRLSESTGDYHVTIENLAQQLRQTEDMGRLRDLLDEVMRETRTVQASTLHVREEVLSARQRVDTAERRVRELEADLAQVSAKAREDYVTGTLNRHGLTEAFERELTTAARNGRPLSVALLAIDNLPDLNDTYGHQAGDDALAHLAGVVKETARPTDTVARLRGEQFLLLLPNSIADHAAEVMVRLQRELTRRFFLHNNTRLLITFSAGVAGWAPGESQAQVIERVERALQRARRAGRNQVVRAD